MMQRWLAEKLRDQSYNNVGEVALHDLGHEAGWSASRTQTAATRQGACGSAD